MPLPAMTFLGHATVLIEMGGLRILTDPILVDRLGFLTRVARPIDRVLYEAVDLVLISHLHLDHLDRLSLARLDPEPEIVVGPGGAGLARSWGWQRVTELAPGRPAPGGRRGGHCDPCRAPGIAASIRSARNGGGLPPRGGRDPHLLRGRHGPLPGDGLAGRGGAGRGARPHRRLGTAPGGRPPGSHPRRRGESCASSRATRCPSTGGRCGRTASRGPSPAAWKARQPSSNDACATDPRTRPRRPLIAPPGERVPFVP